MLACVLCGSVSCCSCWLALEVQYCTDEIQLAGMVTACMCTGTRLARIWLPLANKSRKERESERERERERKKEIIKLLN